MTAPIAQDPVDVPVLRHVKTIQAVLNTCQQAVEPSILVLGTVRADDAISALRYVLGYLESDARWYEPPCLECGAKTPEEAEALCRCGGDKDSCHGTSLWPD